MDIDDDGFVVATKFCPPPPHPWVITESSKFAGRHFFYNVQTQASQWRLRAWLEELPASPPTDSVRPAVKENKSTLLAAGQLGRVSESSDLSGGLGGAQQSMERRVGDPGEAASRAAAALPPAAAAAATADVAFAEHSRTPPPLEPSRLRVVSGLGLGSNSVVVEVEYEQSSSDNKSAGRGEAGGGGGGGLGEGRFSMALKCVLKSPPPKQQPQQPQQPQQDLQPQAAGLSGGGSFDQQHDKQRRRLVKELDALASIPYSPFLQRFLGAFESPGGVFLCLEKAPGGDLFFHLDHETTKGFQGFAEDTARVLLAEIVLGLTHMHKHGFIHRDIRIENILLDACGHVKIVDFGLSQRIASLGVHEDAVEEPVSPSGSLIYMAPELLEDRTGGRHTDWWALGVLAYELFTGRSPWTTLTDKRTIRNEILSPEVRTLPTGDHHSSEASSLVGMLLRRHPKSRLGYRSDHEVQSHSFFAARVDWDLVSSGRGIPALLHPSNSALNTDQAPAASSSGCPSIGEEGVEAAAWGGGGGSSHVTFVVDPEDQRDAIEE